MAIATGVTVDGRREVLGFDVSDSEDRTFWTTFLRGLKARRPAEVQVVISDVHTVLKAAIASVFIGGVLAAVQGALLAQRARDRAGRQPRDGHYLSGRSTALLTEEVAQPELMTAWPQALTRTVSAKTPPLKRDVTRPTWR